MNKAVTTAFIYGGMHYAHNMEDLLASWGQGNYELVCELATIAETVNAVADQFYAVAAAHGGMPGVFDYEVSESLGHLIGDLIVDDEVTEQLPQRAQPLIARLVIEFGQRGFAGNAAALASIEQAVYAALPNGKGA